MKELYTDISNSINRGNISSLKSLLLKSNLIDVTQDGCDFFYLPMERDQPEIINILLDYFFQKQLPRYDKGSYDYVILIKNLKESIDDWTTEYGCSTDMQNLLSFYDFKFNDYRLINAVIEGNEKAVKDLLLEGKIDVNLKDDIFENTALHFAYQNGNYKIIQLLINADTEVVNDKGFTPKELDKLNYINIFEINNSQSTADHNNSPKQGDILKDVINHHSSGELLTSHNIQLLGQEGLVEAKDQVVIEAIKEHHI